MKVVLALDVGSRRIGVAKSDPLGISAQPLEVIDRKQQNPFARIEELIDTYEVSLLVVGKPLTLSGKESHAAQNIEEFVQRLKQDITLPIEFVDERMSTAMAQKAMIAGGARRQKRKENIDKVAAALILQTYLDQQ